MKHSKVQKLLKKFIDSQDAEANSKIILAFLFSLVLTALVIVHMCGGDVGIEWAFMLVSLITGLLAVDKIPERLRITKPLKSESYKEPPV